MATIAVDIDSTLYDFDTPAREACLALWQETGDEAYKEAAYHPWNEWRSPSDVLGVDMWLRAIALVHDDEKILGMEPFKGAVETCQALTRAGHSLLYISNRQTETKSATYQWLTDKGFMADDTDLVVTAGDKRPYMKHCQYLVDDRLKTCVEFVYDYDWKYDMGIAEQWKRRAFLKAYSYNQAGSDIPGLYLAPSWAGLNVYMHSKGLLPKIAFGAMEAV